jgi:sterol desaturase/sphingolipid hydroxylase (fatty acid hydroxylase superfamily)
MFAIMPGVESVVGILSKASDPKKATALLSDSRNDYIDLLLFMVPALFNSYTPVYSIYIIAILRIICTHVLLSLHYLWIDKENYDFKISQKQLERERKDYMVSFILHMWVQVPLQILFPSMFFSSEDHIIPAIQYTFLTHLVLVEPLYYAVHRWLHVPRQMKTMHGFHHMSVKTTPSSSLVQNFHEHFVYIATFGPAFFLPFLLFGYNHWTVIGGYLLWFDTVNAYGHTNIVIRHPLFTHKWSPLTYLFYTPEFHLGHHAYYNNNFCLFMPIWDHLFSTYREFKKPESTLLAPNKQDFVFIGHNAGLGHLLTVPEYSIYNLYDSYKQMWLPIHLEMVIMKGLCSVMSLFTSCYKMPRYLVDGKHIGRVICIIRSPLDYFSESNFPDINKDIVNLVRLQYDTCGTRYFGLGNLNKMQKLNDGGKTIATMIREDAYLKNKDIRIWTGDTLTAASVYYQVMAIPNLKKLFYIGANGKIGNVVCQLLLKKNIQICIYSKHVVYHHPNVTYTQDIRDMLGYEFVLVGKTLKPSTYRIDYSSNSSSETKYLLDYSVPFMPLHPLKKTWGVEHVQIGVLKVENKALLRGYYDICMGFEQDHIYPCHAGCILNMLNNREFDETGDINVEDIEPMWALAQSCGLANKDLKFGSSTCQGPLVAIDVEKQ